MPQRNRGSQVNPSVLLTGKFFKRTVRIDDFLGKCRKYSDRITCSPYAFLGSKEYSIQQSKYHNTRGTTDRIIGLGSNKCVKDNVFQGRWY